MKGSYVGRYGRKRRRGGETKEAPRREVGHTEECWHRSAHGGGPTLTLASRLGRESRPSQHNSLPLPLLFATSTKNTHPLSSRMLLHTMCGGRGEGGGGIIATALCNVTGGAFLAAERRRRRTCIDRIPRTVETVLRKKNITALKYKGDRR